MIYSKRSRTYPNIQNTVGPANYCFFHITVFSKILCPAIYCIKHNIVASLVFIMHQFVQLSVVDISCCRIVIRSAKCFILSFTCVHFFFIWYLLNNSCLKCFNRFFVPFLPFRNYRVMRGQTGTYEYKFIWKLI